MAKFLNSQQAKEEAIAAEEKERSLVVELLVERIAALEDVLRQAYLTIQKMEVETTILKKRLEQWEAEVNGGADGERRLAV